MKDLTAKDIHVTVDVVDDNGFIKERVKFNFDTPKTEYIKEYILQEILTHTGEI